MASRSMLARSAAPRLSAFRAEVPEFTRVDRDLASIPSSNFRSPQVLRLAR